MFRTFWSFADLPSTVEKQPWWWDSSCRWSHSSSINCISGFPLSAFNSRNCDLYQNILKTFLASKKHLGWRSTTSFILIWTPWTISLLLQLGEAGIRHKPALREWKTFCVHPAARLHPTCWGERWHEPDDLRKELRLWRAETSRESWTWQSCMRWCHGGWVFGYERPGIICTKKMPECDGKQD